MARNNTLDVQIRHRRHQRRIHRHPRRHALARVSIPRLHEKALELLIPDFNLRHPLHPTIPRPTRHHHPQRKPVRRVQRRPVHLISQQRIRVQRLLNRNRPLKLRLRPHGHIRAVKPDFNCPGLHPGLLQYIRQPHPRPASIAYTPILPLQTRHRRLVQSPTIPRAFQHAHQFHPRQLPQLLHRHRQTIRHRPAHA